MDIVIYILAGISILLALGGLASYSASKHVGLLLSSIISIAFAITAIALPHWWPLLASFAANWGLRLLGLDPSWRK